MFLFWKGVKEKLITLDKAKKALEASEKKAKELGVAVSTVIVDVNGSIIASSRIDGAIPISPKFAYSKAFTSASLGMPSGGIAEYATEGKPYFGVNTVFGGELTPIAGGVPVKIANKLVGGVGVGGSMDVSQDQACAQEAVKVLEG
ncbi:MAG: heme-binding protein [Patescibacteria group bacterium]|nr:heme-binding protein [Patescibacteria group bacterium]